MKYFEVLDYVHDVGHEASDEIEDQEELSQFESLEDSQDHTFRSMEPHVQSSSDDVLEDSRRV